MDFCSGKFSDWGNIQECIFLVCVCMRVQIMWHMGTKIRKTLHVCVHTHTYAHKHTHTHTHTHTQLLKNAHY